MQEIINWFVQSIPAMKCEGKSFF